MDQDEVEAAILRHMQEYEKTTDLLEDLAEIVQTANRVHGLHGKSSMESFAVDRAVAAVRRSWA